MSLPFDPPQQDRQPLPPIYLDMTEAAELFGSSKREFDQWVRRGYAPVHVLQVGKRSCKKFKLSELLIWAQQMGPEVSPKALDALLDRKRKPQ
jgi:hypothetical protein